VNMERKWKMNMSVQNRMMPRAQAITEFALALPILLMLIYGVLETGRLLFIYGSTITAARQAVRYGSATGISPNGMPYYQDCVGIQDAAKKVAFVHRFEDSDIIITYDEGPDDAGPYAVCGTLSSIENGDRIKVSVSTMWTPIVPLLPFEPFEISSESERTILSSVDIEVEADPSTYAGTGSACVKLVSVAGSPDPYSNAGQLITYTYSLHKYGDADLTAPSVIDTKAGNISCPATVSGDTDFTCTGTYTITQADLDAGSVASTVFPTSFCPTKAANTQTETVTAFQNPGITLTKTPSVEATSIPGTIITYTYRITNSGNVSITGPFSVSDDKIPSVTCPQPATLAPNAYIDCTGTHTLTVSDIADREIINLAVAYATHESVTLTSNTATAIVYTPPIYLVVVPSALSAITPGQVITYTYNIKNITDVAVTSPNVVDDLLSVDCSAASGTIPVGGSTKCTASYTVTQADLDAGNPIVNKATAYGVRDGLSVSSNEFTLSTPIEQIPELSISLVTTPSETPLNSGSTVTYDFTLTNSGNVTLIAPITVVDDKVTITCSDQSDFSPGTTRGCSGIYTVTSADMGNGSLSNSGYATAKFGATDVISNSVDSTLATFVGPRFKIEVSPDKSIATYTNEIITYTYTFTNTGGDFIEAPYTVTSSLGSTYPSSTLDCSLATSPLAPGASTSCKSTYSVTTSGTITNTVTDATAQHSGASVNASNTPVTSSSTTAYICSASNLRYTASPTTGGSGNKVVTWTVSNTVGVPLPISAVIISWSNSGNGNNDWHLDAASASNSSVAFNGLPDNVSSYISGTGTLNTGDSNITMTFSKNNPTGISVQIVFASPYSTCHLP
jgi:uncharacterized repeat protein (TIGR01451 family)